MSKKSLIVLLALMAPLTAAAVQLSTDGTGQVLLFPQYLAGGGWETTVKIRNTDTEFARAVRVVVKDPHNGRPTGALNVYLTPGDSWEATLLDPVTFPVRSLRVAESRVAPWDDPSCTFPRLSRLPEEGLMLDDSGLDEDFGGGDSFNRISTGTIEVYEMGILLPRHAVNCAGIEFRFMTTEGAWFDEDIEAPRNRAINAPRGGLEGRMTLINRPRNLTLHSDALALDDFSDQPLHTHPDFARRPSLMDVSPAISRVLVEDDDGGIEQRESSWDFSVHAVDAVLMTESLRFDFHAESDFALGFITLALPTAAYHNDAEGFYLDGGGRVSSPFPESASLGLGATPDGVTVQALATTDEGEVFELRQPGGFRRCDELRGALTSINLINQITFTRECHLSDGQLLIPGAANRGQLLIPLPGTLESSEGHVYRGLPALGNLFQIFRFGGGIYPNGDFGWIQPGRRQPASAE